MAFLSAVETSSLFETLVPFFRGKLFWSFIDIDIHGIGVSRGSVPSGGGGVEGDWGSG